MRPNLNTVPEFYRGYVECTNQMPLMDQFNQSTHQLSFIMDGLNEEKADYRYQEGKWSLKEMFLHITDTERVFSYRALCISRGERQKLPSMDQNEYVMRSDASSRELESLKGVFFGSRKYYFNVFFFFKGAMAIERVGRAV